MLQRVSVQGIVKQGTNALSYRLPMWTDSAKEGELKERHGRTDGPLRSREKQDEVRIASTYWPRIYIPPTSRDR